MTEKRIELAHDIIAKKIWEHLPEHDRLIRQIKTSLEERQQLYAEDKGGLLGEKELHHWEDYIDIIKWKNEEKKKAIVAYVEESKLAIEKQNRKKKLFYRKLGIGLLLVAIIVLGFAVGAYMRNEKAKRAEQQLKIAKVKRLESSADEYAKLGEISHAKKTYEMALDTLGNASDTLAIEINKKKNDL